MPLTIDPEEYRLLVTTEYTNWFEDIIYYLKSNATIIASAIAFTASIISLYTHFIFSKKGEIRAANRKILDKYIIVLSTSIYQIKAASTILIENKKPHRPENQKTWLANLEVACLTLRAVRVKCRFPLWGLDEELNSLSKMNVYMTNLLLKLQEASAKNSNEDIKIIDDMAKALKNSVIGLGDAIDGCINDCYRKGRLPHNKEVKRAKKWRKVMEDLVEKHSLEHNTVSIKNDSKIMDYLNFLENP